MKYYIFRHSETYFSKYNIHYGGSLESAEIIPEGIPVTKRLAEYLKKKDFDRFFTSPFKRCVQTAEIIEEITGIKYIEDPRIGEEMINCGKETFEDVVERIKNFLEEIKLKNYKAVAICSHGWPIAILTTLITKGKVSHQDLDNFPECGILIEIKNGKLLTKNFN